MPRDTKSLGPRLALATIAGVLLAIAGLLTFYDSPKVFGQEVTSSDATLSGLTLSGIDFGTFDSATLQYTAQVASSVTQTTVTPTPNHSEASYVIKLGGVTDEDGTVALRAGSNVITVEVTAEDGQTMRTYSVTVTRPVSSDATLERLKLSGIDIGDGPNRGTYVGNQTSFKANVYHSVSQTTVTPTVNHSGASYVIKLGGVEDADGAFSLAVGSNVITVEVTAEDDSTTQTYTATVNRATASAPTTGELPTDEPPVNFRAIYVSKTFAGFALSYPRNRGLFGWVGQRYEHDGDSFVSSGADSRYEFSDSEDLGGLRLEFGDENVEPGALYKWVAMLKNSQGSTVIETSVTVRIPPDETTELSSDATLSALTLTGMELEKTGGLHAVVEGFDSTHLSYAASVANSVSQTTVAPTVNHSGATYVINLNGVTDEDGVISLSVGSNIITIEVTAEDGETTRTYTVAVTRADALSTDATLSGLTLSGIDFGTFASGTTSYTASVANSVSQTTVTPTVNDSGAEYVTKLDGVEDADGVVSLSVGSNVITVEVTAEDDETTQTYTVTVTRAENALPTGVPTISGTAQVGQTLTVDTSGIADEDGLTNASFGATWTANEGYLRVLIAPGRDLSYTVSRRDVGMTLEVQVNFEDDAGERHFVTSAKTALVAATSPAAPENFATSVTDSGDVTLSWDAPAWDLASEIGGEQTWGDGGSPITGYVVQWKEASVSWDTEADVSEATVTGTSHTVEGLTVGTDYTTRVIAMNAVGRGIPSDEKTVTVTRPASTDATLSALTLSGIDFGTFASGTTSYTATGRQQRVSDDRYSDRERLEGQLCHQARRRDGCGWRSLAQLGQQRHHHRGDR